MEALMKLSRVMCALFTSRSRRQDGLRGGVLSPAEWPSWRSPTFSKSKTEHEPAICSLGGQNSALVMVDDFSRFVVVELLHRKMEVSDVFRKFCKQYYTPKRIRCDNEFAGMLRTTCEDLGIILEPQIAHVSHQNGVVERYIGLLRSRARAMRIQAAVPEAFNLHAMEYVATMMRFMPQARNNHKTAYESANGVPHRKPGPPRPCLRNPSTTRAC